MPQAVITPVNHPTLATIYPPGAEVIFALTQLAGVGTRGLRALFLLCDVATVSALARILLRRGWSPWGAALFALHPLAGLESAGSDTSMRSRSRLLCGPGNGSRAGRPARPSRAG